MKFLLAFILLANFSFAGIFSEIDIIVKETIINAYTQGYDNNQLEMSMDDIWALELEESSQQCLAVVSGYAKKPSYYGSSTYKFWVCITKNSDGILEGELIDDDQIADE